MEELRWNEQVARVLAQLARGICTSREAVRQISVICLDEQRRAGND